MQHVLVAILKPIKYRSTLSMDKATALVIVSTVYTIYPVRHTMQHNRHNILPPSMHNYLLPLDLPLET
jgi:hypothetical protein